ncbi:MAG TPA: acetate uptake transporter [Terracidiphilus sp.]|nr:acetate uptake transporter [Terracidiphilus sp.]
MSDAQLIDRTGNPAPLGLMGFGMTTVLLNLHNAGYFPLDSMILAMGIFYGGLAQVLAGAMEWKKGNTFAATAFTSYGMFWLTLVALVTLPKANLGVAAPGKGLSMPAYLLAWGIFTAVLFIGTLRLNRALQVVFASLTILFVLLAVGEGTGNESIVHLAGFEGIFCGASAIYTGLAQVLNEVYGRVIWPIGPVKTAQSPRAVATIA